MNEGMDLRNYLGTTVDVIMDRKLGTNHPKHGFLYELNYGYIPNTISGDGEEIDAYVLGVNEPIDTFKGKVIAIIHRLNDNDDKLIVTAGEDYTDEEIKKLTNFQEKFFKSEIIRK
jgi:inorganic pyrophosphatase